MGTKLLLGFGGTVIQVVVHPSRTTRLPPCRFGGMVIQVVVHLSMGSLGGSTRFGGTVIQAVVHLRIKWAL